MEVHAVAEQLAQVVGDLGHRVAAGLLEHEAGDRQHHHRLGDHAARGTEDIVGAVGDSHLTDSLVKRISRPVSRNPGGVRQVP